MSCHSQHPWQRDKTQREMDQLINDSMIKSRTGWKRVRRSDFAIMHAALLCCFYYFLDGIHFDTL